MALNDTLSNALSHILNCEKVGKKKCIIKNASKLITKVLDILKQHKYVGDYKVIETTKGRFIELSLTGAINKCGSIKPRFPVKKTDYEKFEKRYLPAKNFGILIVSTNKGIMTHNQAIKEGLGGKLLAYCY
jgi:small subunit ribosomal protein S8